MINRAYCWLGFLIYLGTAILFMFFAGAPEWAKYMWLSLVSAMTVFAYILAGVKR